MRAFIRWTPPIVMTIEIVFIVLQAARGTTSHFNNSSVLDAAIFAIMGLMITVNTMAMLAMLVKLRRDTPPDRAGYLWGVRMGIALFILASLEGFVIVANNAHTVALPDGGPGLPFVNWSTQSGDLRVAHFVGMHALQGLPLLGYLLDRSAERSLSYTRPNRDRGRSRMAARHGRAAGLGAAGTASHGAVGWVWFVQSPFACSSIPPLCCGAFEGHQSNVQISAAESVDSRNPSVDRLLARCDTARTRSPARIEDLSL